MVSDAADDDDAVDEGDDDDPNDTVREGVSLFVGDRDDVTEIVSDRDGELSGLLDGSTPVHDPYCG